MATFLKKLKNRPQKLLVARTDRIGDFVLTLPFFEVLHRELGISFSVLCQELVTPLLQNNPYVDEIITIGPGKERGELLREIQSKGFDGLLVLVNDKFILDLLPALKFIPTRIGPLSKPKTLLYYTHPVLQKRSRSIRNEAEYNLELLEIFGLANFILPRPKFHFSDNEIKDFLEKLPSLTRLQNPPSSWIILHAGMQGSALNWNEGNYRELLQRMLAEGKTVMLTGAGEQEKQLNQRLLQGIQNEFPDLLYDMSGKLSLRELAILLHLADLFIGPSTGPTHIANAAGTPLISFYPPIQVQSKIRWQPFLAESKIFVPAVHCGQKYRCIGERCQDFYCMDLITPDQVFQQVKKMLGDSQKL